MDLVIIVALAVGGSTIIGSLLGLTFKNINEKWNDIILSFAAGVMLAAAIEGLILPSVEYAGKSGIWMVVVGVLVGAIFLTFADRLTPHLHHITGVKNEEEHKHNERLDKILLFVLAITIHNFPEGLATGVAFGTGNTIDALKVAFAIVLQNIPEGLIVIAPMLANGISKKRAIVIASFTGIVEIIGTFIGYFMVGISTTILPIAFQRSKNCSVKQGFFFWSSCQ